MIRNIRSSPLTSIGASFGCQKGTQSRQHLSLYVAHKLRGVVDASVPVAERTWYLFPAPEPLYCAPSPEKGGWGQPQQRHECHSSGTFRRVKYSVVRSKKLCELERCSRLGLAWGNGVWLEGCPQVKRCVPTFVLAG